MNLAVLKYQFITEKPANIPNEWPAETRPLSEGEPLPSQDWVQMTDVELAAHCATHQAAYDAWEDTYFAPTPDQIVAKSLRNAERFGKDLIEDFKKGNVLSGITQAGKTKAVADYCHRLEHYIGTGSLYAALAEIDVMLADITLPLLNLSPYVTTTKLNEFKAKIQAYLGM